MGLLSLGLLLPCYKELFWMGFLLVLSGLSVSSPLARIWGFVKGSLVARRDFVGGFLGGVNRLVFRSLGSSVGSDHRVATLILQQDFRQLICRF